MPQASGARHETVKCATHREDSLLVAVLSDLHACSERDPDDSPSHYCIHDPPQDFTKHPITGLKQLIDSGGLVADLLICPGDIADKAHPLAIRHAWQQIQEVGQCLNVRFVAATAGNHDVDSRFEYNDFDAKGVLQSLQPPYPFPSDQWNDRYWARHFLLHSDCPYRLLVLNSSAFHGEGRCGDTQPYEFERGRVSDHTLRAIRKELDDSQAMPVNILLCHHHPHPHSELRLGQHDLMMGGQALLELLGSGRYGRWLVVHGHKHHPKIENAAGGAHAPVVFAAGSLCATLYKELQTAARNQFYILEFPYNDRAHAGFGGTFRAWDWLVGSGWVPATETSGLPAQGGFGWRGDPELVAHNIAEFLADATAATWQDIRRKFPFLDFFLPQDFRTLRLILERQYSLALILHQGVPIQLGKRL